MMRNRFCFSILIVLCSCSTVVRDLNPGFKNGKWAVQYHSRTSIKGILNVLQNACRSPGMQSCAKWPLHVADRQKGNFHLYLIPLVQSWSSRGRQALLCWWVMVERSWKSLISVPLRRTWLRSLAFLRIAYFNGKFTRQHIIFLGGSFSWPLVLSALWILSISMEESAGLSSKSLNIPATVCSMRCCSTDSGIPLIRMLWWQPRLSRSSRCQWISRLCDKLESDDLCTCLMASTL